MNTTSPALEQLKIHDTSLNIAVDMHLASIPVTITGQYNVHSNSFYPSRILPTLHVKDGDTVLLSADYYSDLEGACERLSWNYDDTYSLIQEAVENRDRVA